MYPNRFEYSCPDSLQEAISLLSAHPDEAKILAGGQSLLSMMKLRLANPSAVIDLSRIPNLAGIREENDKIRIGSMTTYSEIIKSKLLWNKCPLLPQTASLVADVQVRNRGTIGGSLAHADPAADLPAAIVALEAEMKAIGPRGERWIRSNNFFLTVMTTELAPDEILTEIRIPILSGWKTAYLKNAPRPCDFAIVGVAASINFNEEGKCNDIALGITGVSDKAYRPVDLENALRGKMLSIKTLEMLASKVIDGIDVNDSIHASKDFRSQIASFYVVKAIMSAAEG